MGARALLVALCSAVATVCFLNAMRLTAVADVMVIDAAIPFVTAALAWLILGERENAWTLGATVAAFIGMAVMAGPAIVHGRMLGRSACLRHGDPDGAGDRADPAQEGRQHGAGGLRARRSCAR